MTVKRRPQGQGERVGHVLGAMADGTLGGRLRVASPARTNSPSAPSVQAGTTPTGGTTAPSTLPLTTKGDLLGHDGSDEVRVPVGTATQVLTPDDSAAAGVAWATMPGGITVEAGSVDANGAVTFRWGIDAYDRPYFDSTGAVALAAAARLYLAADTGRFYLEDLPL